MGAHPASILALPFTAALSRVQRVVGPQLAFRCLVVFSKGLSALSTTLFAFFP
jgi:hypothetical protein